jgi:hypothetical protein
VTILGFTISEMAGQMKALTWMVTLSTQNLLQFVNLGLFTNLNQMGLLMADSTSPMDITTGKLEVEL